jgi:hypothetical protein
MFVEATVVLVETRVDSVETGIDSVETARHVSPQVADRGQDVSKGRIGVAHALPKSVAMMKGRSTMAPHRSGRAPSCAKSGSVHGAVSLPCRARPGTIPRLTHDTRSTQRHTG